MRRRLLLPVAGLALSATSVCLAQTPAVPTPLPEDPALVPAQPAYNATTPAEPLQQPAPTPAPPPVVVPAVPTPQAPYGALPPYDPAKAPRPYLPYGVPDEDRHPDRDGSAYIPVDSWIYPEMTRLYSLGYVSTMYLSMRPWTRKSVVHMLEESESAIRTGPSDEAREIYAVVSRELKPEFNDGVNPRGPIYGVEQAYTRVSAIGGQTLRDSYHLGTTLNNDYGRPYQPGFNNISGASYLAEYGRFSFYARAEYQHAPSAAGYGPGISNQLAGIDFVPLTGYNSVQATIPQGPIASQNPIRIVEAGVSVHLLNHEISFGKNDAWLGPAQGAAMAWSNNAENIYAFRINRVEPLHLPLLSALLGPVRYDFFLGSLKGHTAPNSPYVHSEMFSFRPTGNVEITFQRTVIFGGQGHEPVTLHTFLKGFFDISDTTPAEKYSRNDPGARFSDFSASWRLPFVRRYATFYVDSIVHDDVTPISAPRRASFRTGLYLAQLPRLPKLDLRVEAAVTDPKTGRSLAGQFAYFEIVQLQGYTNKGYILGDWIGREAKGGQAWLTYHLSGNEWVQLEYLNKKTPKDFIPGALLTPATSTAAPTYGPGGTTQNSFKAAVVKRFCSNRLEFDGSFQYERWKAPIYLAGPQSNTVTALQFRYFPALHGGAH